MAALGDTVSTTPHRIYIIEDLPENMIPRIFPGIPETPWEFGEYM